MPKRLRPQITFANVVSCLALFVALGSGAYAATHLPKNSVGTKQIKKEAVTAVKVKKRTLTGTEIDSSTLGIVPTAQNANTSNSASVANSLAPPEGWHEVGAAGEPQFQNGCNDIEGVVPVGFFKDHESVVHLEGNYEDCSSKGKTAFQLPTGYRPGALQEFPLAFAGEGPIVAINPTSPGLNSASGAVKCGDSSCFLNGITFRAES